MPSSSTAVQCLIVGAGLSGLTAAKKLTSAGLRVKVVEQKSVVGGRLASTSFSMPTSSPPVNLAAVYDYGAQFFTARSQQFQEIVDTWKAERFVAEWSLGFAAGDGSYFADGHPRYRGNPDMVAICEYLARDLDLDLDRPVENLTVENGRWTAAFSDTGPIYTSTLILTPPVPLSLALLEGCWGENQVEVRRFLGKMTYDPCLALAILMDNVGALPHPGGLWPFSETIDWIADNFQKGISPLTGAFTIHASADYSREIWDSSDEFIAANLLKEVQPWISGQIVKSKIYRWPNSKPTWTHSNPYLMLDLGAPVIFAGDAFAGPRVEGAVLSGLAAADRILAYRTTSG